jgi:6-phosphogluconolactonase (cycloisomerase 2 family)
MLSSLAHALRTSSLAATAAFAFGTPHPVCAEVPNHFDPGDYRLRQHTLYVNGNITSGNAILAYDIHPDGSLHALPGSPFLTGGSGFFDPSFVLGPFDVDQEMALYNDVLYAVNGGSNTISALRVDGDGSLRPLPGQPFTSGGSTPVSLGVHGRYLVTVDSAQDPAQSGKGYLPGLITSEIKRDGGLRLLPGSAVALVPDAQPSQALTANTGPFVFSAEFPGGGHLDAFVQAPNGKLIQTDSTMLPLDADGKQPLPLGLWGNPRAPYLYVGFVNTNELGVYTVSAAGKLQFVGKTSNSGAAVCWIRASRDGRFLYTANTGDNSMSVYDLHDPASPVEIQHIVVGGTGGAEQFSLTPDGHFLYLLEQVNSLASASGGNRLFALEVDADTGLLKLLNDFTTELPVPVNNRPFGVTIR